MSASASEADNGLSLTEQQLFTLFARYPEITFDPENRIPEPEQDRPKHLIDELDSSPISTAPDGEKSQLSNSTAHTTPLRPLYLLQQPRPTGAAETVAGYLRLIQKFKLTDDARRCFTTLARNIGAISAGMVPSTNGRYRINNTFFMDQCSALLEDSLYLIILTNDRNKLLDGLMKRVLFQVIPDDYALWAIYRQRAQLVVRLTALPSTAELVLINGLARLYNSCIYRPAQDLIDDGEIEEPTIRILTKLYDAFFTWLTEYRLWCKGMKVLKQQYMAPLQARLSTAPAVCKEAINMQTAKENAEILLTNPVARSMMPILDEQAIQTLNLSARNRDQRARRRPGNRTKSRRQRTL